MIFINESSFKLKIAQNYSKLGLITQKHIAKTKEQKVYNTKNSKLMSDIMVCVLSASDGSVWAGTYNGGLAHYYVNTSVAVYTGPA